MASVDEDSDEYDYIDDPIKLIHYEQTRVDDCNNNSEEFLEALRKSALNNRPIVQIVDCKKFPWYYKRSTSRHTVSISEIIDLDDDDDDDDVIYVDDDYCNIQVSEPVTLVSAESNPTIVDEIENISTSVDQTSKNIAQEMSPTKPKIRPVNIADYNLGSAKSCVERDKHLSPKTIPSNDTEKQTVKQTLKNAVETPSLIDFKKNLVVGLKIVNKVAMVASKNRSKIKDLFGDDDDIEIPIKGVKHKVQQEHKANNRNVNKNDTSRYLIGTKILPFKGDTSKAIETQKTATKLDSVTSKQVTSVGSPDRFCNKLLMGSKLSSQSTSIKDSSDMTPKSDSMSKSGKNIEDSAIEINNASLKFTITRKNTDEYCLSINDNEQDNKSKKKDKIHKKHKDKTKSMTGKKAQKGDDVSSRDKIKFKRDKKHKKDSTKSKDDKSYKQDKSKSVVKESNDITKEVEKKTLDSWKNHGDLLAKSNQLNGVKYIVHSSKQEVNAVNPDTIPPIYKSQESAYLNEKVVNDVLRLQRYVDDYVVHPEITVSKPTEITQETAIARSPIQASITISYSGTPSQLTTTPEQPKHVSSNYKTGLSGSGPQQKKTSPVVQSTFFADPKMTSKDSLPKNDQRSEQTSRLFKERPLQAKHKSICQTNQSKSLNISKTPPRLCNGEPLRRSIDGSWKPFSSPNCKDLSMPSLSPDPEIELPMNETDVVENQPVEKTIDQNDNKCKPKSGKNAKRLNSTVKNKKGEPTQIAKAKIKISCDASSAKKIQKQKNNKTPTASTTTVSGKQQIQSNNIKELEKMKHSIQANINELKNSIQISIQELGHGDAVSQNLPNNLPENTVPVLQDSGSQNVHQTEKLNPIPTLINENNTNCEQNQNRFHVQYPYNNNFHNGFGPRGPVNPHMFHGPIMNRAPPPWLYQSMEPRQRYRTRMPQQMFYTPPNTPAYRPYNGPMPTEMLPPMPKSRQSDTPMPTQMIPPTSRQCNTPMPPMPTSQQPYSTPVTIQNQMMPTSQLSLSSMPTMPMSTSEPYNYQMSSDMMPSIPTSRTCNTPMTPMSNSRAYNTQMLTEMMPPTQPCSQIEKEFMPPLPASRSCNTPMPPMPTSQQPYSTPMTTQNQMMPTSRPSLSPMPTSGPYNYQMSSDMMPPIPTSRTCNTPMPPMSNSRAYNTPMPTEMMPPTQPCSPMEKDFMPPLSASRPCNTHMPPMPNSRPCNTPMPTQMMPPLSRPCNTPMLPMPTSQQPYSTPMTTQNQMMPTSQPSLSPMPTMPMPTSGPYNYQMSSDMMPPIPTSRPCNTTSMPSYMMSSMPQQSPTEMPSIPSMSRPQPPCTPMPSNMPTPRPPSTPTPSDLNSSIRAKTWNIPPASKYVRCSPVYETPPLNSCYPPSYEQNSFTNQSWPYHPPLPQDPAPNAPTPPPPPPASTPPQGSNNQMPLTDSSTDDSIIGRNPDDGHLIRRIALSKPNSSAVINYINSVSATPGTPVSIPEPSVSTVTGIPEFEISSVIGSNQSASIKSSESSTAIASPKPSSKSPKSDSPVNDKSQMLVELCKAVGIDEPPIITTPTKEPTKRPADPASLHPTLAHMLIPKKRKLSSSIATESQNKSKNVPVSQCGYSPPILPIPTHEKTFELLSKTRLFSEHKAMDDSSVEMPNGTDDPLRSKENMLGPDKASNDNIHKNNTTSETRIDTVNRNEEMNGKDNSVRKISLDEYKKRVPRNDDTPVTIKTEIKSECLSPNSNKDGANGAIRQSTESDLGYDSDSTIRL